MIVIVFISSVLGTVHLFLSASNSRYSDDSPGLLASIRHRKGSKTRSSHSEKDESVAGSGSHVDDKKEYKRAAVWDSLFGKDDVARSGVLENSRRVFVNISNFFLPESTAPDYSVISRQYPKVLFTQTKLNFFNSEDKFLTDHFTVCRNLSLSSDQKLVLLLIPSEPEHSLRRQIVRDTWIHSIHNLTQFQGHKFVFKHLFMIGKTADSLNNPPKWNLTFELLRLENSVYDDLLIGDFIENYWNLTYKTMFGVTWANFYCRRASFVAKIDDDVFVRPEKFLPLLESLPKDNLFGGNCIKKGKPHRNKKSKWYISKEEYARVRYPPFCFGPSYFFSGDLIPHLFNATLETTFFKLEDVYMGLCIEKAGKTVQSVAGVSNSAPKYTYCAYKDLALAHGIEPTKWSMYYRDIAKRAPQNIVCPKKVPRKSTKQLR